MYGDDNDDLHLRNVIFLLHAVLPQTLLCQKLVPGQMHPLSSPRAKRAGPKGLGAESARAVTGRRCPHSGVGEDFLAHRPGPLTKMGVTREGKVVD